MLRRGLILLVTTLSLLILSCSSSSHTADDLPEQEELWRTTGAMGNPTTSFHMTAWGYTLDRGYWHDTSKMPELKVNCHHPTNNWSRNTIAPDLPEYYRSIEIDWEVEKVGQPFDGAEIITEFKRAGRGSILEHGSWYVYRPGNIVHFDPDDFVWKARKSWLLEIRMYRQGLPVGGFYFDLRGLTDLFDQVSPCKK